MHADTINVGRFTDSVKRLIGQILTVNRQMSENILL